MDHAFYAWLHQTVPTGQYNRLVVALNAVRDLFGPEMDDIGINILSRVGYEDSFNMVDRLQSDLLTHLYAGARLFGVTIRDDHFQVETIGPLTTLLRGILGIEHYELVQSLNGILHGEYNKEELLAELVAEVMAEDPHDLLAIIQEVPDALIARIQAVIRDKAEAEIARLSDAQQEFSITQEERERLLSAFDQDDGKSPIYEYVITNQRIGIEVNQALEQFGHWISNLKRPEQIAKAMLQVGLIARIEESEIPTLVAPYMDKLVVDIHRIMAARKALLALIKGRNHG